MNPAIQIYNHETIHQLQWPDTEQGNYAKRFLLPLLSQSPTAFIENVTTELWILLIDNIVMPFTVNDQEYDNCYVCSPYTHYVTYAKQELILLQQPVIEKILTALLSIVGFGLRLGRINQTIHMNNWLLSTNLYVNLTSSQLKSIVDYMSKRFPTHSLAWRSLNPTTTSTQLKSLAQLGCRMIPSRQIYLLPTNQVGGLSSKARWLIKRDYSLLEKNGYELISPDELNITDMPRLKDLYNALYLDKYSRCNPWFSERFLDLARQEQLLNLYALRHIESGRIDGVLGYFYREGIMTTPIFGYDTQLPQATGLYRMLSAVLIRLALEHGYLLHESSGAAQFKRNRGAAADIEYTAIYDQHLPSYRRWGWSLLGSVLNRIGVPIMKKYKF